MLPTVILVVLQIAFWLCVGAMLHTYVLYPLTLRLFPRRYAKPPEMPENGWPRIAVLIAAYNEEQVIRRKIENTLALDYPPDKMEVLIGSDGSTDRTNEIARGIQDPRVRLYVYEGRNGKPGVLNRLVKETTADVLVMTDANVRIEPTTFRNLIRHFADPGVAGVAAAKAILKSGGKQGIAPLEHRYAAVTASTRSLEGAVGGYSGTLGAYYAMRRELFQPFPLVAMNDDILSLYPAVAAGKRVAYEPTAIAYEDSGSSVREEFRRRIRIGASNFKTLELCHDLLRPSRGMVAYSFFSHKVLHWYFPFFMLLALLTNALLLHFPFYRTFFEVQAVGYGIALLGWLASCLGIRVPLAFNLYYFVAMNIALFCGWWANRRRSRSAVWEPTARKA